SGLEVMRSRRRRSVFLHSGVRICPQESLSEVLSSHRAYYQLRVCQEAVWEAFRIFLDRIPGTSEYQSWVQTCQSESLCISDIALNFSRTDEHLSLVHRVRAGLEAGLERVQTRFRKGLDQVTLGFDWPPVLDSDLNLVPEVPEVPEVITQRTVDLSVELRDPGYRELLEERDSLQYNDLAQHLQEEVGLYKYARRRLCASFFEEGTKEEIWVETTKESENLEDQKELIGTGENLMEVTRPKAIIPETDSLESPITHSEVLEEIIKPDIEDLTKIKTELERGDGTVIVREEDSEDSEEELEVKLHEETEEQIEQEAKGEVEIVVKTSSGVVNPKEEQERSETVKEDAVVQKPELEIAIRPKQEVDDISEPKQEVEVEEITETKSDEEEVVVQSEEDVVLEDISETKAEPESTVEDAFVFPPTSGEVENVAQTENPQAAEFTEGEDVVPLLPEEEEPKYDGEESVVPEPEEDMFIVHPTPEVVVQTQPEVHLPPEEEEPKYEEESVVQINQQEEDGSALEMDKMADSVTLPPLSYLTTPTMTSSQRAPELVVFFSLRVTNLDFSEDLFNKTSSEYKALESRFREMVRPGVDLDNLTGFRALEVLSFSRGSVVVSSKMSFTRWVPYNVTAAVQNVLEEFCANAVRRRSIVIDRRSLDVEP
ncbi:hypothetical protein NQD34_017578, partial [Periophthalmus magnuspinnatus]